MLFYRFGYLPGLSEILSHSELIPDAALTLTAYEKEIHCTMRFNLNHKIKIVTPLSV